MLAQNAAARTPLLVGMDRMLSGLSPLPRPLVLAAHSAHPIGYFANEALGFRFHQIGFRHELRLLGFTRLDCADILQPEAHVPNDGFTLPVHHGLFPILVGVALAGERIPALFRFGFERIRERIRRVAERIRERIRGVFERTCTLVDTLVTLAGFGA